MKKKKRDKWDYLIYFSFIISLAYIIIFYGDYPGKFFKIVDILSLIFFGSIVSTYTVKKMIRNADKK